ncbi:glycoside hydrolase family 31 protein [Streptomyces sp. HNS054]|uniref:glycoside hydrolase family 31 protein n=1 Tax=Streptomyces sp. HNS054 TaxID=1662446 RepID=UPI00099E0707|nr:glycoside hydrolase family 31 protein [Streptomyces sp. HNS054]WPW18140.1 glycoside hydrolase family 31 protein [Streptomyces griseoincarnatus]
MNGRDLVRSWWSVGVTGAAREPRTVRAAWLRRGADATGPGPRVRARVPGAVREVEPGPGGGVIRFARSELRVLVAVNGAVFWGWDGAGPEPSYALAGACPEPDPRAELEPDTDGGWRVVAERVTVAVSRHGALEVLTPGGVTLRRDLPPRWWEAEDGGPARWMQRSEVPADARFFGPGGPVEGPRPRDGAHRLGNGVTGTGSAAPVTMPVQLVVADAGTHLLFVDNPWDGTLTLREGAEGAGSGHDRVGTSELRMEGGPVRGWVMAGTPARVLLTWASLAGAPALPPAWAFGHHHVREGAGGEDEVRRVVAGHLERGLPLDAVHLGNGHLDGGRAFTVDQDRFPKLPVLADELRREGVRLVSVVPAAVRAEDRRGEGAFPDLPDARVRYAGQAARGFAGVWHRVDGSVPFGRVDALRLGRAAHEGLRDEMPADERPLVLSPSGWPGSQRYGGVWSGEGAAGWPGLRASLARVVGLGLCGVPFSGPDVVGGGRDGGFELYVRRLQLAAYLPLLRTGAVGPADGGPRGYGAAVLGHARVALGERRRLLPYFVTLAHLARRTGAPMVRPVWWPAPEERQLRDCEDAFLLGDALLVAPVLEPGAVRREVRLPRGRWYDTATGRAYEGPAKVLVDAPLERIPVFARAGAVLPVRAEDGGTELEVWAPAPGRSGGGLVVPESGDDGDGPEAERYSVTRSGPRVVVRRETEDGAQEPSRPVRVRGLDGTGGQM